MQIYKNKSNWKWLLAVMGFVIVLLSMFYSQYLAKNLADRELAAVKLYTEALRSTTSMKDGNEDTGMELAVIQELNTLRIILEDESGKLVGHNYSDDDETTTDQKFLQQRKERLLTKGLVPVKGFGSSHRIYFENSKLYSRISFFPLAQILLLGTFVLFGYYVFSTSRRAEQNRVWAGMAKETAHQLGTPISAIIGWIEHLKEMSDGNEAQVEVVTELRNDVSRLELIADRFSKIGSKPELEEIDLIQEMHACVLYMKKRASRRVDFKFPDLTATPVRAKINSHLFDWVIENLLRNALDAMDGQGQITVEIAEVEGRAQIDISDTGKGIPTNKQKTVFNPGYTTKKRGWGLGLSLAKRIIENYHSGKIFVKNSKVNEGTTFTIQLPLA